MLILFYVDLFTLCIDDNRSLATKHLTYMQEQFMVTSVTLVSLTCKSMKRFQTISHACIKNFDSIDYNAVYF